MWFLRLLLVLAGTAVGFVLGGNLTQDATGALALGFVAFLLMMLITKRRRPREVQVAAAPAAAAPPHAPRRRSRIGTFLKTIFAMVGVSGIIAVLKYQDYKEDQAKKNKQWAEDQYNQRLEQITRPASISGHVFDNQTKAPMPNASVGFMAGGNFVPLTQTAPDGSFRIDRPFSPQDHYPIQIAVSSPGGGRIHVSDAYLHRGQDRGAVVIYTFY